MILGRNPAAQARHVTLDDLFRRAGVHAPSRLALVDPPDRQRLTGGRPRALTFAEADRAISALAARLRALGLQTDAVIGIQLGNTVESVVALLGVLRAGMIAAALPLLWRKQDMVAALNRVGAKAIITATRIGEAAHADIAAQAAVELFAIRHVCAFGDNPPDGVAPLDGIFAPGAELARSAPRPGEAAGHVAVVTFEMTARGLLPVARTHAELIAGAIAVSAEADIAAEMNILSAIVPGSFASLGSTIMPWLLTGGTLALHHPFDAETFATQCSTLGTCGVALPGPALHALGEAGLFGTSIKTVVGLWRAVERLPAAPAWPHAPALTDVMCLGEIGILAARREAGGRPSASIRDSSSAIEAARSAAGTLMLRGAMVPVHPFPPGAEHGDAPHLTADDAGFVDSFIPCRRERDAYVITGPPAGTAGVGGYRFGLHALEGAAAAADPGAAILSLPDALTGQKLAGSAPDPEKVHARLAAQGVHPLVSGAFRSRTRTNAA